tara:strand:- start:170 stop:472 length:303 start_codon:yes stop_codon:yes gene_type:complete
MIPNLIREVMTMREAVIEVCSGDTAFTIVPPETISCNMDVVTERIENAGFICKLKSRFCHVFEGDYELTLYPSGKLLLRAEDIEEVQRIASLHLEVWLAD